MESVNSDADGEPDELTRRMIDIGGRMLAEHGENGLSLRKLAVAAGTSTMTVYTRFGSKQQLLAAMYREGFRRLGAALAEPASPADPVGSVGSVDPGDPAPLQALAGAGLAYRRAALQSPTLYGLMFGPSPPGFTATAEDAAAAESTYEPLRAGCRHAVDAGIFHGDPDRIALHLWSVAHGMVSLELAGRIDAPAAEAERLYAEALAFAAAPFLIDA